LPEVAFYAGALVALLSAPPVDVLVDEPAAELLSDLAVAVSVLAVSVLAAVVFAGAVFVLVSSLMTSPFPFNYESKNSTQCSRAPGA
jgi:hypothetical protein